MWMGTMVVPRVGIVSGHTDNTELKSDVLEPRTEAHFWYQHAFCCPNQQASHSFCVPFYNVDAIHINPSAQYDPGIGTASLFR